MEPRETYRFRCREWEILEAMTSLGGSFVKQLATLYRLADNDNQKRLVAAFHDYFIQYDEMAALLAEREKS